MLRSIAAATILAVLLAPGLRAQAPAAGSEAMPAFRSDEELRAHLRTLVPAREHTVGAPMSEPAACAGARSRVRRAGWFLRRPTRADGGALIQGTVRRRGGAALPGGMVDVASLSVRARTDSAGKFRLLIPAASVEARNELELRARAIGYAPRTQKVQVAPGAVHRADFDLCPDVVSLSQVVVTGTLQANTMFAAVESDAITNVQHDGVDEGGIVKRHGGHLVILRRGRLFTVAIGDSVLRPVAAVDAFPPDTQDLGGWYDELLVHDGRAVVIGYSYARDATELNLFRIDDAGALVRQATYHLRSDDYYSSRNYASRLIDGKLILYTPLYVGSDADPLEALPALRRWRGPGDPGVFERIVPASRVYRARRPVTGDGMAETALHTVTTCDLRSAQLNCTATVVVGPPGEVFYVSPSAIYLWTSDWRATPQSSVLFRLPLDGAAPGAIGVRGGPIDQFSFLEDADGQLDVLVSEFAPGSWMWNAERRGPSVSLLRLPLTEFGDGSTDVPAFRYRPLPPPTNGVVHNRFVGSYLLYGGGDGWGPARTDTSSLFAVAWRGGAAARIDLRHGVDRIEVMGPDAVVIGAGSGDLHFTGVRLGEYPEVAQRFRLADAAQGETRSHGFFYRPEPGETGLLGLPVSGSGRPGWAQLRHGSAAVLLLRNDGRDFADAGQLVAAQREAPDDACKASCVDWYGNARPIFLGERLFALLGYELVEGRMLHGRVNEVRRVDFAPPAGSGRRPGQ